jgi:hypothetical protein
MHHRRGNKSKKVRLVLTFVLQPLTFPGPECAVTTSPARRDGPCTRFTRPKLLGPGQPDNKHGRYGNTRWRLMPTTIQECGCLCHWRSRQGMLRRVADASNLTRRRHHYSSSPRNSVRQPLALSPIASPTLSRKVTAAQSMWCVQFTKSPTRLRLVAVRTGPQNTYPASVLDNRKPSNLAAWRRR